MLAMTGICQHLAADCNDAKCLMSIKRNEKEDMENMPLQSPMSFCMSFIRGLFSSGWHSGLVVSALDTGSGSPGSSPGQGTVLCSWTRYFTLIVPFFTQVHVQMSTREFTAGGNAAMD